MKADMPWRLPIESGACEYMKVTCEGKKLIRLACTYLVTSREESSLIDYGWHLAGLFYLITKTSQMENIICT